MQTKNSKPTIKLLSALVMTALALPGAAFAAEPGLSLQNALGMAIKNSPKIIERTLLLEVAKAEERGAGGVFNPNVTASLAKVAVRGYEFPSELQAVGALASKSDFMTDYKNQSELKTGLSKIFRNGIYTGFTVTLASENDAKKRYDVATGVLPNLGFVGKNGATLSDYFPAYQSTVEFTLNFPLLKFSGENNIATANETNLRFKRMAGEATLKHEVATIINNVVVAYWANRADVVKLQLMQQSESQVKGWLAALEKYVETSKDPKATRAAHAKELAHLGGFLTQRGVDVAKAQEDLAKSRAALADALGTSRDDAQKLGNPSEDFPLDWSAVQKSFDDAGLRKRWNDMAQANRYDLKAADLTFEAANAIMLGAENDALPKLDLAVILKRQGLAAGGSADWPAADSLNEGTGKWGHTVQLAFAYPIGNDKAESLVAQTRIDKMVKDVQRNNTRRGAGLLVDKAVSDVRYSIDRLESAKKQTAAYVIALDSMVKSGVNMSKVFDLVVIETARVESLKNHVDAVKSVADALTAARFQTGTLLKEFDNVQQVATQSLTTLP